MARGDWWEKWNQPTWPMLIGFIVLVALPIALFITWLFSLVPTNSCGRVEW